MITSVASVIAAERLRPWVLEVDPEEVGLVIRPAVGGPFPDIEYLACADDLPTCARLAAQLQQRLARSVAEADAYCRRLRRPYLRLIH
jgi:hypothetical protein